MSEDLRIENPLEDLIDLFAHSGWKRIIEEMTEAEEVLRGNLWHNVENERQLYEAKGRIKQLRYLIHYEAMIRASMESEHDAV